MEIMVQEGVVVVEQSFVTKRELLVMGKRRRVEGGRQGEGVNAGDRTDERVVVKGTVAEGRWR